MRHLVYTPIHISLLSCLSRDLFQYPILSVGVGKGGYFKNLQIGKVLIFSFQSQIKHTSILLSVPKKLLWRPKSEFLVPLKISSFIQILSLSPIGYFVRQSPLLFASSPSRLITHSDPLRRSPTLAPIANCRFCILKCFLIPNYCSQRKVLFRKGVKDN